jgi:hypothetical protein
VIFEAGKANNSVLCNTITPTYPVVRKLCQECKAQAKENGLTQGDYIGMIQEEMGKEMSDDS